MMTRCIRLLAACILMCGPLWPAQPPIPRIIFDADMSSDHDDAGALALLHGLADLGECEILACMASSTNGGTALCMQAINTYYGRAGIPCGRRPDCTGPGSYPGTISAEFPHPLYAGYADPPLSVELYRRILAAQPDRSVTIVTVGYLNNLQDLLQSQADAHSPLAGRSLVARKVRLWSCMGGVYPRGYEFNFTVEKTAACAVVNGWPTAAMFSGFAIGNPLVTGARLMQTPRDNPIRRVWELKGGANHASWDQTAVYYAVRSAEETWAAERTGRNTIVPLSEDAKGQNVWDATVDPTGDADQGFLLERSRTPVQTAIDVLMAAPPKSRRGSRPGPPTQPTNLRVVERGPRIVLRWTDNAYDELGFVIERGTDGRYAQVAAVGADVVSWVDAAPVAGNTSYRVKARNPAGDSAYACTWLYSGWTEVDCTGKAGPPLYEQVRDSDLRWARGGDYRPDHVTVNRDSEHGRDVTIEVDVGAMGAQGSLHVYVLYQDKDNWCRLRSDGAASRFERRIGGVTTALGQAGPGVAVGNGSALQAWKIQTTSTGILRFTVDGVCVVEVSGADPGIVRGRIGLGGEAKTPIWENVRFHVRAD